MNNAYTIEHATGQVSTIVGLPASKSESNRALIINACTHNQCDLINLSEARDTRTLRRLLQSGDEVLDVIDAGTTMRFLTAYMSVTGQRKTLTGTERMQQRPIGILVEALKQIGADIRYKNIEGYPPLETYPFQYNNNNTINIRGDISSQFISALLLVSPLLPEGLKLNLEGKIGSRPYIEMTLALMENFGVKAEWTGNTIYVPKQTYQPRTFHVESDWSGASYWYSIAALANEAEIKLNGLKQHSLQGDSVIADFMPQLGVYTRYEENAVVLTKGAHAAEFSYDFTHCPDLAQTIAVIGAAKGIKLHMTGLESLRIKETDRTAALQAELHKFGHTLSQDGENWTLTPNTHAASNNIVVETYDDHRMAMAFAPLALVQPVTILNPAVVDKSYPRYWEDLTKAGFALAAKG